MTMTVSKTLGMTVLSLGIVGCVSQPNESEWVSVQGMPVPQNVVNTLFERCQNKSGEYSIEPNAMDQCLLQSGILRASSFYDITPFLVEATAKRLNADTPVMVDDATRLDSVEHQGRTLRLNHTIIDDVVADINVDQFQKVVPELVMQNTCFAPPMAALMENDVVFQYTYNDAEGQPITAFSIRHADCK
ncbi:hypothetical protein LRP49_07705 [Enterovibrio sp. ZSDZ35]|uniref:Lipoprotein n=1 Tax=Enterovibrio qingdaonensis TaxID=2899818 RepID=A0ABT5QJC2_9GAMM|nr:hypothetical protein [Enterovibrio sp. ZSDZ35]MDD1781087.1 hypothetical protein [Enterovibrio sp. ZSDZ35]